MNFSIYFSVPNSFQVGKRRGSRISYHKAFCYFFSSGGIFIFFFLLAENLGTNWASKLNYEHIGSVRKAQL